MVTVTIESVKNNVNVQKASALAVIRAVEYTQETPIDHDIAREMFAFIHHEAVRLLSELGSISENLETLRNRALSEPDDLPF